jgi:hypothetical protein
MKLSARIKGGPVHPSDQATATTTTTKTSSSMFIKIYKNGHDSNNGNSSKRLSNIEKKSVVKLVKGPPKTFTTFIPVPIRKARIGEAMVCVFYII